MDTMQTVLLIFCLLSNSVRTEPTSLQIKHLNPSQRIQIEFNQTIRYPILIKKSPRLTYEENVALFLQNDPDISLQITKLDYARTSLAHFPNKLLSLVLPNLSEMNFSHNSISSLSSLEDFSRMLCQHQIQSIDFSFNNLSIVDDQNFGHLSRLSQLNLSHNQISQIGLFAFSVNSRQIARLDLSHNLITDSSLEFLLFSSLINLKWLSMDHNRLTFLSNHFLYNLYNLEYLSVKNNLLKTLDLFYIVNRNNQLLGHIDLSNNFHLKFKVYQRSAEEKVPENNVQILDLSGIDLSHLDLSIFLDNLFDKYKKLKSLNLSSAGIKSIVWSTKWPRTLQVLDLSNNFLKNSQFDCSQFYLSHTKFNFSQIDLSANKFENFSRLIDSCSALFDRSSVDLRRNHFESLSGLQSSNCTASSRLRVAFNRLVCDCENLWWQKFSSAGNFLYQNVCFQLADFTELKCDSVSSRSLAQMSSFALQPDSASSLWKISTFQPIESKVVASLLLCPYRSHCPQGCRCVRDLLEKFNLVECTSANLTTAPHVIPNTATELRLDQNGLRRIYPYQFFARSHLTSVDLSENKIGFIEENGFSGIRSLKILKLSSNSMQILLGYEFKDLVSLEQLHLDSNQIQFISNQTFYNLPKLKLLNLMHNNLRHLLQVNVFFRFNLNLFNLSIDRSKLAHQDKHASKAYDDIYFHNLIQHNLADAASAFDPTDPLIKCILHKFKREVFLKQIESSVKILLDNLLAYKSFCDQVPSGLLGVATLESKLIAGSNLNSYLLSYVALGLLAVGFSCLLVMLLNKYRRKSDVFCFKHINQILKSKFMPLHRKRYDITHLGLVNRTPYYDLFLIYNKMDSGLVTKLISPIFRSKPYNFKLILQHDKIKLNDESLVKYVVNSAFVLFVLSKNLFSDFEYDLAQKLPRSKKLAILADDVPESLAEKLIQPGRILRGTFNLDNMSFNFKSINIYEDSLDSGFDNDRVMDFDSFDESFVYKQGANFSLDFDSIQTKGNGRKIEF